VAEGDSLDAIIIPTTLVSVDLVLAPIVSISVIRIIIDFMMDQLRLNGEVDVEVDVEVNGERSGSRQTDLI